LFQWLGSEDLWKLTNVNSGLCLTQGDLPDTVGGSVFSTYQTVCMTDYHRYMQAWHVIFTAQGAWNFKASNSTVPVSNVNPPSDYHVAAGGRGGPNWLIFDSNGVPVVQ
jgi:hypothetical protein